MDDSRCTQKKLLCAYTSGDYGALWVSAHSTRRSSILLQVVVLLQNGHSGVDRIRRILLSTPDTSVVSSIQRTHIVSPEYYHRLLQ